MKKLKILEIGGSSLLDFDYKNHKDIKDKYDVTWVKGYRSRTPKHYDRLVKLDSLTSDSAALRKELINVDVVIYSIGNKGPRKKFGDHDPDELYEIMMANYGKIVNTLPRIINQSQISYKPIKVIFMGSVAGREDSTYPNHAMYASMKAALASLFRTLWEEYEQDKGGKKLELYHLEIPYTASNMTDGRGESPDKIRDEILSIAKMRIK